MKVGQGTRWLCDNAETFNCTAVARFRAIPDPTEHHRRTIAGFNPIALLARATFVFPFPPTRRRQEATTMLEGLAIAGSGFDRLGFGVESRGLPFFQGTLVKKGNQPPSRLDQLRTMFCLAHDHGIIRWPNFLAIVKIEPGIVDDRQRDTFQQGAIALPVKMTALESPTHT